MIEFSYNAEEDIFLVKRTGKIRKEDMLHFIDDFDRKYSDHKRILLLTDAIESTTEFDEDDYPLFIEAIKRRLNKYEQVKDAVVVNTPYNTALTLIYEYISNHIPNYSIKPFSSFEAAKQWLKQDP